MSISHQQNGDASWQHYLQWRLANASLGFELDFSTAHLSEDFFTEMKNPFASALQAMEAMENGARANIDEDRMVGHYWLRSPERAPLSAIKDAIHKSWERIRQFCQAVHSGTIANEQDQTFQTILLLGIGGSSLGPQLLADALLPAKPKMTVAFLDNTDPAGIAHVLASISDLSRTLVIIVSKSGSTVETRNAMLEVKAACERQELQFCKRAMAITGEGSQLDDLAKQENWLATFPLWDWVGGRTSIFSPVGLLPMALLGLDWQQFIAGARIMDEWTRVANFRQNPAAVMAGFWYAQGQGHGERDMVILPYCDRLMVFSRYLQQLVMESLGKRLDRNQRVVHQGLTVYGNKGSTDQHAYVQQLRDGLDNFFVVFIRLLQNEPPSAIEVEAGVTSGDCLDGFYQGTRKALYESQRYSTSLVIEHLDALILGALIALFERTVGIYAELININAYHQPGVEAGKKAAREVLDLQRRLLHELKQHAGDYFSYKDLAARLDVDPVDLWQVARRLSFYRSELDIKISNDLQNVEFAYKTMFR